MSDEFDDEYGIAQGESAKNKTGVTYELTIKSLPHEAIIDEVYRTIAERTEAKLTSEQQQRIKSTIDKCVNDAVERIVDTRLEKEVNDILDNGWQQYDQWGSAKGPRVTLRELVTKYIMLEVDQHGRERADHYSSDPKRQRIQWFVDRAVGSIFDKESSKLVEDFRIKVRERFTDEMAGKVTETIKSALGFR